MASMRWRNAPSPWRAPRPRIGSPGSPIRRCWRTISRSRSARSRDADGRGAGSSARSRRKRRACRRRRRQIGRRFGLGRHRRHGAGDERRLSRRHASARAIGISMSAIAGDGTGMEQDYDFTSTLHAADLDSADAIGRNAGERAVKRLNPRKVATRRVPVVFDPRISGSLVGHVASAANGGSIARKTSFLREKLGQQIFARRHRHHRRSAAASRPALARRSTPKASPRASLKLVEDGVLKTWLLDSATARELDLKTTGHAQRGVSSVALAGAEQSLPDARQQKAPRRIDRRDRGRLLCHRPDRHGRQSW